ASTFVISASASASLFDREYAISCASDPEQGYDILAKLSGTLKIRKKVGDSDQASADAEFEGAFKLKGSIWNNVSTDHAHFKGKLNRQFSNSEGQEYSLRMWDEKGFEISFSLSKTSGAGEIYPHGHGSPFAHVICKLKN